MKRIAQRTLLVLGLSGVMLLTACHGTGSNFKSTGLNFFTPGVTTLSEAIELLDSDPVNRYYRADGSYLAIWQHTNSLFPDGVYFNRELWAEFDAQHRLIRVVKGQNVEPVDDRLEPSTY